MSSPTTIDLPVKIETTQTSTTTQEDQHFILENPPISSCKSYAGFWIRVNAFLIDFATLYATMIVSVLVLLLSVAYLTSVTLNGIAMIVYVYLLLFGLIGVWLYFSLFESSRKQATPGKLLLCIKVVGSDGSRMSFGTATKRYFSKFLSALTLGAGYIMAGFTSEKQALHDMITDSFVIRQ
jgi:uncharacterized RDD family membrane protein YckC